MTTKSPKAAASKSGAAVVVPPAPTPFDRPVAPVELPEPPIAPVVVVVSHDTLKRALERIASGRLCGCKGDHDELQYECPKSIARAVLEGA